MKVEIWSDVVCPFCYIGKRNYEAAIAQFAEKNKIEVDWKSFQLDPAAPQNTTGTYMEYLSAKKGWTIEQAQQMMAQVSQTAKKAGLDYQLENTKVVNTSDIHRVIQLAKEQGLGDEAEEAFFKAYFIDASDLNDRAVLLQTVESIGMTEADMKAALTEKKYTEKVNADIREANQLGINGVPFFVFNRKYAISGAQPAAVFLQTLEKAFHEWRQDHPEGGLEVNQGAICTPEGTCK